jgi:hypothetical protein
MDRRQAAFRLRCEFQKLVERTSAALSPPRWNRGELREHMRELPAEFEWMRARAALARQDFKAAHVALGRYFMERRSAFPLDAVDVQDRASLITRRFPNAAHEAAARADALTRGEYDLLGYRAIHVGSSVDWHADPVSRRRARLTHWAAVRYLNPAYGDHKVIWEINRHQHWLALGRAHALTGSRQYYDVFRRQMESWMVSNPPTIGINWASMLELGFRTISWMWAIGFFSHRAAVDDQVGDDVWLVDALLGINRQLRHIERNLSLYFSPNTHLTGEALALYVAGRALPELAASSRWADLGREVLLGESRAQVLADGGHAELSGHYHRYSTDFYLLALTVARASADPATPAFEQAARKQALYLRTITDDQGRRPATGDDDGGQLFPICGRRADDCRDTLAIAAALLGDPDLAISGVPEEAFWWCGDDAGAVPESRPTQRRRSAPLPETGYYVSRNSRGDHLLFDAGRHGFLNGGHAHSDALAIVLTVAGRPLLVDPGTATYTMDRAIRDRLRSTAMHNTLLLDARPQSEPDGPFHWRARANARATLWRSTTATASGGADYVEGTHDGYLPRRHIRSVLAIDEVGWWILDTIVGEGSAEAATYWHLHPSWHTNLREGCVLLRHTDGAVLALASGNDLTLELPGSSPLAFWSPEYGRIEPAPTIKGHHRGDLPLVLATFIPADGSFTRCLTVRRQDLRNVAPQWLGSAWQATWDGGEISLLAAVRVAAASEENAWSPTLWGTADLTTDGRVACLVRIPHRESAILIDGSFVKTVNRRLLAAQLPTSILRQRITNMAPLVHEQGAAEARVH